MDKEIEDLRIKISRRRSIYQNLTQHLKLPGEIRQRSLKLRISDEVEHGDLQHTGGASTRYDVFVPPSTFNVCYVDSGILNKSESTSASKDMSL